MGRLKWAGMLACLVLSMPAHADRLADIKARGSLICATLTTSEPLGFIEPQSRQVVGFDVDMCDAIAKRLQVRMEHKGVLVEERIAALINDSADLVVAALGYTRERARLIDYTASHYQNPIKLIARSDAGYVRMSDLAEKRISANKDSTPELYVRRMFPKAAVQTFPDTRSAFLALAQDKVDGLALSQPSGIRFVNDSDGRYQFLDGVVAWEPTAMGVKKGEAGLRNAVNDALEKMEKAGEIEALWLKWYGPRTKFNIPREKKLTPISTFQ